jgi:hypothetical protein
VSKVADAAIVFGEDTELFGELVVGNPGCDFCWDMVRDMAGLEVAKDTPATHVFNSDCGLVFTCNECAK